MMVNWLEKAKIDLLGCLLAVLRMSLDFSMAQQWLKLLMVDL